MEDGVSTVFHSNRSTTLDQEASSTRVEEPIPSDVKYSGNCSSCASGIKPIQKMEENRDTTPAGTGEEYFNGRNPAIHLVKIRRRGRCCSARVDGLVTTTPFSKASSSSARVMNRERRENDLLTTLRKYDQKSTQTLHQLKELYAGDRKMMTKEQHYLKIPEFRIWNVLKLLSIDYIQLIPMSIPLDLLFCPKVTQASWRKNKKETKTLIGHIMNALADIVHFDQSSTNMNPNFRFIEMSRKNGRPIIGKLLSTVQSILADLKTCLEMSRDAGVKETEKFSQLGKGFHIINEVHEKILSSIMCNIQFRISISEKRRSELEHLQLEESKTKSDFQALKLLMVDVEDILCRWQSDLCFEISLKQERISCSAIKNFEFCVDKIVRLIDENEQLKIKAHHLNVELSNMQPSLMEWASIKERIEVEISHYRTIIVSFSEKSNPVEFGNQSDGASSLNVFWTKQNRSHSLFLLSNPALRESNHIPPLTDEQIMVPIHSQVCTLLDFGRKKLDVLTIDISKNSERKNVADRLRMDLEQALTEIDERMIRHEKELADEKNENLDLSSLIDDMKKRRIEKHRRLKAQYSSAENTKISLNKQKDQLNSEIIKLDSGRRDMQMSLQKMQSRLVFIETDIQKVASKTAEKIDAIANDTRIFDGRMNDFAKKMFNRSTSIAKLNDRISTLSADDYLKPSAATKLSKRRNKIRDICSKMRHCLEQRVESKNNVGNDLEKLASEKIVVGRERGTLMQSIDRAHRLNAILLDRLTREESSLNALRSDLSKLSRVHQLFQQQVFCEGKLQQKVAIPSELEFTFTQNDELSVVESKVDDRTLNIEKDEEENAGQESKLRKCRAFDDIRIHQKTREDSGDRSRSLTNIQSTNASDTFHSIKHDMEDFVENSAIQRETNDINGGSTDHLCSNQMAPSKTLVLETAEQYVERRARIPANIKRCAIRKPSTILFSHISRQD